MTDQRLVSSTISVDNCMSLGARMLPLAYFFIHLFSMICKILFSISQALEKPAKLPGQAAPGQPQQPQQPGAQGQEQPASEPPPLEGEESHGEQVAKKPMPVSCKVI